MKIGEITHNGDKYTIRFVPSNIFEKLFGVKPVDKVFHHDQNVGYTHHKSAGVYYDEEGQILGWKHTLTYKLDAYRKKLEYFN